MRRLFVVAGPEVSGAFGRETLAASDAPWAGFAGTGAQPHQLWRRHREAVHRFHDARRVALADIAPTAAHALLAAWWGDMGAVIVTTAIDDLLERAGCGEVRYASGRLTRMRCGACGNLWDVGHTAWCDGTGDEGRRCPHCGTTRGVRPDVPLFGERPRSLDTARRALASATDDDVLVVIGPTDPTTGPETDLIDGIGFGARVLAIPAHTAATADPDFTRVYDHVIDGPPMERLDALDRLIRRIMTTTDDSRG